AGVRSAVRTSAGRYAARAANSASERHRTTTPGASRAARPARWTIADLAAPTVTRPATPRPVSNRGWRSSPESTTIRTPETVSADSATLVANTMRLLAPEGGGLRI